jgi:serine/threonine protein kinase
MGQVYRARDTRLGRTVAVKVLPPNLSTNPAFRLCFEQEARAVSALSHPNVCALYDVGQAKIAVNGDAANVSFIVMEYLDGEDLRTGIPA